MVARTERCRACAYFRNSPAFLEAAFPGLSAMSSAWGATRADDGLCLKHDRYLSADSGCADFTPQEHDGFETKQNASFRT